MKITEIGVTKVKNLGNYENLRLEVTATVEEGETPAVVAQHLHEWVTIELAQMERRHRAPHSPTPADDPDEIPF